jgi:hypothetical protein
MKPIAIGNEGFKSYPNSEYFLSCQKKMARIMNSKKMESQDAN